VIGNAVFVMRQATGEVPKEVPPKKRPKAKARKRRK
jgi:hypothetical protein